MKRAPFTFRKLDPLKALWLCIVCRGTMHMFLVYLFDELSPLLSESIDNVTVSLQYANQSEITHKCTIILLTSIFSLGALNVTGSLQ